MRTITVLAGLFATPALAHTATLPHAHSEWTLPVGLCLIAAAVGSAAVVRVRSRK